MGQFEFIDPGETIARNLREAGLDPDDPRYRQFARLWRAAVEQIIEEANLCGTVSRRAGPGESRQTRSAVLYKVAVQEEQSLNRGVRWDAPFGMDRRVWKIEQGQEALRPKIRCIRRSCWRPCTTPWGSSRTRLCTTT